MNKNLKRILIISLVGLSIFIIKDWQKKKIEFQREKSISGWYKYSNNTIEFEYPRKLRNCYECNKGWSTGKIFKVLTDEEYIINIIPNMDLSNSSAINPIRLFTNSYKHNDLMTIQLRIDSIVKKNNLIPTNSFIEENLHIEEIQLNSEEKVMNIDLSILNERISHAVKVGDINHSNHSYWEFKKGENRDLKQFFYDLEFGRFFLRKGSKNVLFEFRKIKNFTKYLNNKENEMDEKEIMRFFDSITIKE